MKFSLDTPDRICYNTDMNRIEQTTLSIEDISEHHRFLEQQHCIAPVEILPIDRRQEVADDMLERFIHTFLEDIEL